MDTTPEGRFVAASDCECIHDGVITQPVNTATSLAYVAAGVALAARGRRSGGVRPFAGPVAGALVLNGLGSVAYHGPGGRWGKWLHDTGLVAINVAGVAVIACPLWSVLTETGHVTVSVSFLIICATIYTRMLAMSGMPQFLVETTMILSSLPQMDVIASQAASE